MELSTMVEWTDQEAAALCCAGGESRDRAFEVIYERYAPGLLAFARRIVTDKNLAEDVVQESFVRLYQKIDNYRPEQALRPYLFKIAHHVALKALQKQKRLSAATLSDEQESTEPGTLEQVASNELQCLVANALQALAPEYRSIIVLRHMNGLKHKDLASVLACTDRTIRNRLHTAAILFERELERNGLGKEQQS